MLQAARLVQAASFVSCLLRRRAPHWRHQCAKRGINAIPIRVSIASEPAGERSTNLNGCVPCRWGTRQQQNTQDRWARSRCQRPRHGRPQQAAAWPSRLSSADYGLPCAAQSMHSLRCCSGCLPHHRCGGSSRGGGWAGAGRAAGALRPLPFCAAPHVTRCGWASLRAQAAPPSFHAGAAGTVQRGAGDARAAAAERQPAVCAAAAGAHRVHGGWVAPTCLPPQRSLLPVGQPFHDFAPICTPPLPAVPRLACCTCFAWANQPSRRCVGEC